MAQHFLKIIWNDSLMVERKQVNQKPIALFGKRIIDLNFNQNFAAFVALLLLILACFFVIANRDGNRLPSAVSFSQAGSTTLVPDTIRVSASAITISKSSVSTLTKLSNVAEAMREVLVSNNVLAEDFSSANLSLYPEYSYTPTSNRNLTGYRGSQNFEIIIKNIASAGVIIDQLVAVSDNQLQINSISAFVLDPTAALKVARKDAMDKAKIKAQDYAMLANKRLGMILSISENINGSVMQPLAMTKDAGSSSFDLGSMNIEVLLSVSYQIR